MNVWTFDDDESVALQPRPTTKTLDLNGMSSASAPGWGAEDSTLKRRRSRGCAELVVEDEDGEGAGTDEDHGCVKANEIVPADVVDKSLAGVGEANAATTTKPPLKQAQQSQQQEFARSSLEIGLLHLVREFLLLHNHSDVVQLLDCERSMPPLDATALKLLRCRLVGSGEESADSTGSPSLLEQFIVRSNEVRRKSARRSKTRFAEDQSATAEKKPRERKSTRVSATSRRKKPELSIITNNLGQLTETAPVDATPTDEAEGEFNRLDRPGSTPKPQTHEPVIGRPGSTPMARTKDLRAMGFDDVNSNSDDDETAITVPESSKEQVSTTPDQQIPENLVGLSEYAIRKRTTRTGHKHVHLGDPGSTPTKEYIFFRETPPSFVTETIEEAVEVIEQLGQDPAFVEQAAVIERFVELQSSEVSKYAVGQQVLGLGAQRDINGIVTKIYGSRQCGTSGPGTIVIDRRPEEVELSDS